MGRDGESFHEIQRFPLRRIAVALAIPPCTMLGLLIWQVGLGHPVGKTPMSNGNVVGWTVFLWFAYFWLITARLVTQVDNRELVIAMRGLWRVRRVAASEISSVEAVRYDPERDYGGYGIRTTREGKAFIASGDRGVRIHLADGSVLILGSQRPDELARVLAGMIERKPGLRSL